MVIRSNFSVLTKIYHPFLLVGVAATTASAFGVYRANSAALPKVFFDFTLLSPIEVRQYQGYHCATCRYQRTLSETANRAFYHLYQYISSNEIVITAPVETGYFSSISEGREISSDTGGSCTVVFSMPHYRYLPLGPVRTTPNIKSSVTSVAFSMMDPKYRMRLNATKFGFPSN